MAFKIKPVGIKSQTIMHKTVKTLVFPYKEKYYNIFKV